MNKVILLGRMARDPEVRFTQGNEPMAVCRFAVAVDRPYSSRRTEGDATADFINCVCFGKRGESIGLSISVKEIELLLLVDYRLAIGRIITVRRDILLMLSLRILNSVKTRVQIVVA